MTPPNNVMPSKKHGRTQKEKESRKRYQQSPKGRLSSRKASQKYKKSPKAVKAVYDLRKRKNEIRWELQKVYFVPRKHVNRIRTLKELESLRDRLKGT